MCQLDCFENLNCRYLKIIILKLFNSLYILYTLIATIYIIEISM